MLVTYKTGSDGWTEPQEWSESMRFHPKLTIKAATYGGIDPLFDVKAAPNGPHNVGVRSGRWGYRHVILPAWQCLVTYCGAKRGLVRFDGDVVIPALYRDRVTSVWMSHTPMEVFSQRSGIEWASGTVLVGGFGMGWALRRIAEKTSVKRVICVEKSGELIEWFGRRVCDSMSKVELVHGDVYEHIGKHGSDVKHVLDIWEGYRESMGDFRLMQAIADAPKAKLWCWGGTPSAIPTMLRKQAACA